MEKSKNLAWLDLEMTGLNPEENVIIEISSIVTDSDLNILAEGPSIIINQPETALQNLSPWILQHHKTLLEEVKKSTIELKSAEKTTIDFLSEFCLPGLSPLCGNSVWQDRRFMIKYMCDLNNFFHYRNIDVSSVKELVFRWYGDKFVKSETHRAAHDIKESIDELKFYRKKYFKS